MNIKRGIVMEQVGMSVEEVLESFEEKHRSVMETLIKKVHPAIRI
ncbi:hypothetical protein ACF3NG_00100 [Aerococcaceae bacterium WGS1372]